MLKIQKHFSLLRIFHPCQLTSAWNVIQLPRIIKLQVTYASEEQLEKWKGNWKIIGEDFEAFLGDKFWWFFVSQRNLILFRYLTWTQKKFVITWVSMKFIKIHCNLQLEDFSSFNENLLHSGDFTIRLMMIYLIQNC